MNSIKTLFMAAILVAVLYGVHVVINRSPGSGALPDVAQGLTDMLNVDPGTNPSGPGSPAPSAGMAPAFTPNAASPAPAFAGAAPMSDAPTFGTSAPAAVPGMAPGAASPTPSAPGPLPSAPPDTLAPASGSPTDTLTEAPRVLSAPPIKGLADAPAASANPAAPSGSSDVMGFMGQVDQELKSGHLANAHLLLSQHYDDPALTPEQRGQMEHLLDQLAGTIIYSPDPFLEQPYQVRPSDTLQTIAEQCNVPAAFLAKINGLDPSAPLQPGQQLKVVHGPFDATISLGRHELTLTLAGQRYAGRFPIGVGPGLDKNEGTFMVTDKTDVSALPGDQNQAWGTRWIGLGRDLGIHGTNEPESIGKTTDQGYIRLGRRDVEDVYDILTIGSKVIIRR